jgi:hypothetical protein
MSDERLTTASGRWREPGSMRTAVHLPAPLGGRLVTVR